MEDIPTFPSSLPQAKPGFGVGFESTLTRTQMESGRSRQRKRFSTDVNGFSVEWSFTNYEFEIFKAFLKHKLNSATDWFYINLYTGGELRTVKARVLDGTYSATETGVLYWDVSAQLETYDDISINERLLDFILNSEIDVNSIFNILEAIKSKNDRYFTILNYELAYPNNTKPWA